MALCASWLLLSALTVADLKPRSRCTAVGLDHDAVIPGYLSVLYQKYTAGEEIRVLSLAVKC